MIIGLALGMLTVGCTKDMTKDVVNGGETVVIGVGIEAAETRTNLGPKDGVSYPILWAAGDKVEVNGTVSEAVPEQFVGTTAAQFTVSGVSTPYNVIYPAGITNEVGNITIPTDQQYTVGSFAPGSAVMVGASETADVALKNICGFVKVPVLKGDELTIASVTLMSNNLEAISGEFSVDYAAAEITPVAGKDFVKVSAAEGIPFVEDKAEVIIAVPAGTYTKGFSVKVVSTDGHYMTKTAYTAEGRTIAPGVMIAMPDVEFFADGQVNEITTAAQLQAFLDAATAGSYDGFKNDNGEVLLGSDIDMTGVTITPAASFDGVFNGQGYALKNWVTVEGLFTSNSGTIKNIVIDESCGLQYPIITENSLIGFIVDTNSGTVSGCTNNADILLNHTGSLSLQYKAAALVGYSTGLVANCVNNGDISITIEAITGSSDYFGGVVANTNPSEETIVIQNCVNNGNISVVVPGLGSKNVYLGGVCGATNSRGYVKDVINKGDVYYEFTNGGSGAYPNIGGVVGYSAAAYSGAYNYGAVELKTGLGVATSRPGLGGVAGYISKSVDNCHNYGTVKVTGAFASAGSGTSGGTGGVTWPSFGGVFGIVGNGKVADPAITATNCSNNGELTLTPGMLTTNNTSFGLGGVAGVSYADATNCVNNGTINFGSTGRKSYLGGIIGVEYANISDCENNGKIVIDMKLWEGQTYAGGITGYISSGMELSNSQNVADITISNGTNTAFTYLGGIMGSNGGSVTLSNCNNYGNITSTSNSAMRVAGLCGSHAGTLSACSNHGAVKMVGATVASASTGSAVAGLAGHIGSDIDACANYGEITNSSAAGAYTGGLCGTIGNTSKTWSNCTVDCTITTSDGVYAGVLQGGQINNAKVTTIGTADGPVVVKGTTTVNGVAVTAEDCADLSKMLGYAEEANAANFFLSNVVFQAE